MDIALLVVPTSSCTFVARSINGKSRFLVTYPNVSYEIMIIDITRHSLPQRSWELHYYIQCHVWIYTLRSNCQGRTLIPLLTPLLTPTVDTMYSDGVLIACLKPCQFTLCNTDVQESSIWGLGIIGGNVDEVKISTVSTAQCPAHRDIHSSISILIEVNTGEGGDRRETWRNKPY